MAEPAGQKFGIGGIMILSMLAAFVIVFALFAVPVISESTGIAGEYVIYALGAVFLVIAFGATFWAKAQNRKKSAE